MPPRLKQFFKRYQPLVDHAMDRFLPKATTKPSLIHKAMRYSVFAGGKRLRPILVIAAAEICGGKGKDVLPAACAMEFIHTYSLIHDDLPAMDNDDLRRGRPTSHKVFGEDMAILAGDALLTQAFDLVAQNARVRGITAESALEAIRIIVQGAGTRGMIGGQVADIKADKGLWKTKAAKEFRNPSFHLDFIHYHKTAALIIASLGLGARLVEARPKEIQALGRYGRAIGLAFQVQDDLLDCVGDKKKLGKRGSDQANQKLTFPALYGLDVSRKKAESLVKAAHNALSLFGKKAVALHDLADFVLNRDH